MKLVEKQENHVRWADGAHPACMPIQAMLQLATSQKTILMSARYQENRKGAPV